MKSWIKQYYRIYLAGFIAILVCMTWECVQMFAENEWLLAFTELNNESHEYSVQLGVWSIAQIVGEVVNLLLYKYVKVLMCGIIIIHAYMLWGERLSAQREFLETLPAKKHSRVSARIVMDVVLVCTTVIIASLTIYIYIKSKLASEDIHIEWLGKSVCGVVVTTISYVMFIVGIIYLMESVVVSGDFKILTVVVSLLMANVCMNNLFCLIESEEYGFLHKVYGYLNLYTVGGCYYEPRIPSNVFSEGYWHHSEICAPLIVRGEVWQFEEFGELGRFADFANADSYVWYAVSYLLFGLILMLLAVYLTKKQELSKKVFYFGFGSTIVGMLIALTVFSYGILFSPTTWNSVCIAISSVIIFVVFVFIAK